jgi:hypothetical protein
MWVGNSTDRSMLHNTPQKRTTAYLMEYDAGGVWYRTGFGLPQQEHDELTHPSA